MLRPRKLTFEKPQIEFNPFSQNTQHSTTQQAASSPPAKTSNTQSTAEPRNSQASPTIAQTKPTITNSEHGYTTRAGRAIKTPQRLLNVVTLIGKGQE